MIAVAMPTMSGEVRIEITGALLDLQGTLAARGIPMGLIYADGCSLIHKARDALAHACMSIEEVTHIFWLDADVLFRVEDVIDMLDRDRDYIFAPIVSQDGRVYFSPSKPRVDEDSLLKVTFATVSCSLIKTSVFRTLAKTRPVYLNTKAGCDIPSFFETPREGARMLGEDFFFSRLVHSAGIDMWAMMHSETQHFKTIPLVCNLKQILEGGPNG